VLFHTLLPHEARRLYDVARPRERSGHLNVIFTSMVPWIADKPWEFAFDPDRKTFLATQKLHFVRNALTSVPAENIRPKAGPLRILVAVAQPIGTGRLSWEQEEVVIRRGFQPLVEAGLVEIEILRSTTPMMLHRYLSANEFDVVHFVGHGSFDEESGKGYLLFEDDKGAVYEVDARTACEIMSQRGIRLIFLNACETGRGERERKGSGKADFNRGIAPALVAAGVPAVVANQFSVRDQAATEFAQHFYWSLAQGMSFGAAAREARIAVNYSSDHDSIDWAIPVNAAESTACSSTPTSQRAACRINDKNLASTSFFASPTNASCTSMRAIRTENLKKTTNVGGLSQTRKTLSSIRRRIKDFRLMVWVLTMRSSMPSCRD
jgi:hypothetical protein